MSGTITTLDLFAGAGGLTRGLHAASDRFVADTAVEFDAAAAATYSANFPETRVHAMPIQDWLREHTVPQVDLVVGGPPCQGFSALGKQDVDDERNDLWRHHLEAVRQSGAKYFVMENVPQFWTSPQFQLFKEAIEGGELDAYDFDIETLNAADYGAPQARRRAVVLGWRKDVEPLSFPKPTVDAHRTVAEAFEGVRARVSAKLLPDRREGPHPGPFRLDELHLTRDYTRLSLERFAHIGPGQNRFAIPDHLLSECWRRHTTGSGDVMGRLRPHKPSVTIRTEFFKPEKGRYLHPTEDRAITHLEAGLLQGFPPESLWYGSKTEIARQIGNAVPIPLGAAIGRELLRAIDAPRPTKVSLHHVGGVDRVDVLPEAEDRPAAIA